MKRKIILIEPSISGHHLIYLLTIATSLKKMGCDVEILTSPLIIDKLEVSGFQSKPLKYHELKKLPRIRLIKALAIFYNLLLTIQNLREIKNILKGNEKGGLMFFCCIDDYMNELMPLRLFNMIFPINYSGLLLTPRDRKIYFSFDKRKILLSKYCNSIGVLDEFCRKDLSEFCTNIIQFPDFSDESVPNLDYSLAIEIQHKANGRKIVSLLGGISTRKGIHTFIESSSYLSGDQYFFVIAGKSHLDEIEERFVLDNFASRSNCYYYNDSIPTESDFNMLISISCIVYAAYVNFSQSSNMLAKSSLFKKPLIVSKGAYMEEIVNKYSLGLAIDPNSVEECMDAIHYYSKTPFDSKGCSLYLKNNSIENLNSSFENVLKCLSDKNKNTK